MIHLTWLVLHEYVFAFFKAVALRVFGVLSDPVDPIQATAILYFFGFCF
jgi:hypothetical protein